MEEGGVSADSDDVLRGELRSVLDEELQKLPGRLRDPLVLCYLHGRSHDEAASLCAGR